MTKKAYLIEFTITTRIILDSENDPNENEDLFAETVNIARTQILENGVTDYIHGDNVSLIEEDIECPYDSETDK